MSRKKTPFYIGTERYFEVTLQQAGIYASKYNRVTAYTQQNISTSYSIQIEYTPTTINLWGIDTEKTIVPFQLAYAVSIHKAQGLEYKSVKVIIPSINAEKITHGIFYTAITRAKEQLKIYWSSETMQKIVAGFSEEISRQKSLSIIKEKLHQNEI